MSNIKSDTSVFTMSQYVMDLHISHFILHFNRFVLFPKDKLDIILHISMKYMYMTDMLRNKHCCDIAKCN